jgi:hypothetical protein
MSGARLDLGENDLALAELQIPELNPEKVFAYSVPLFYAYADTLEVLGKDADAKRWTDLAKRAEVALNGNPGPEDEVFEVLEEFEIPVRAERKEWEPREERGARDDRGSRDERPRNFAPRNAERPARPYGERSERPARPARDNDAPRPTRDRAPREGARDRKFGEDRGR